MIMSAIMVVYIDSERSKVNLIYRMETKSLSEDV